MNAPRDYPSGRAPATTDERHPVIGPIPPDELTVRRGNTSFVGLDGSLLRWERWEHWWGSLHLREVLRHRSGRLVLGTEYRFHTDQAGGGSSWVTDGSQVGRLSAASAAEIIRRHFEESDHLDSPTMKMYGQLSHD